MRCGLQGGACTAERKKPTEPKPAEVERSSGRASHGSYSRLPRWRTWFGQEPGQGWGQGRGGVRAKCEGRGLG